MHRKAIHIIFFACALSAMAADGEWSAVDCEMELSYRILRAGMFPGSREPWVELFGRIKTPFDLAPIHKSIAVDFTIRTEGGRLLDQRSELTVNRVGKLPKLGFPIPKDTPTKGWVFEYECKICRSKSCADRELGSEDIYKW
jgi:hypothetical protein